MPHWLFGVRRFLVTVLTHVEWQLDESIRFRDDARQFLDHQVSVAHGESGGEEEPDLEVASGESEDIDVLRRRLARAARRARAVRTAVCIIQAMLTHRSPERFMAAVQDYLQDHSRSEVEITAAEVSYLRRSRHCRLPDS